MIVFEGSRVMLLKDGELLSFVRKMKNCCVSLLREKLLAFVVEKRGIIVFRCFESMTFL